jgi:hypothetical protein
MAHGTTKTTARLSAKGGCFNGASFSIAPHSHSSTPLPAPALTMSSSGTGEWPGGAAPAPAVAVVEPALGELLTRLRLARPGLANREGLLTPDDRAIFAAGIEARRAVLQNTLALVLAQWTFYRVAIRNLPRPARAAYGATQIVVAGQFVRFRARKVDVRLGHTLHTPNELGRTRLCLVLLWGVSLPPSATEQRALTDTYHASMCFCFLRFVFPLPNASNPRAG